MKFAFRKQLILLVIATAYFGGCSSDPNRRKQGYLDSGGKYFARQKYQEAIVQFRNALQIDPRYAAAHYQLARAYLALGNAEAAFRELNDTVALNPANSDAQLALARLLIARRQYEQAQAIAQKVIKAEPGNAMAHASLAEKYTITHDLPNAMAELKKVVELDPQRVENYAAVGSLYVAQGKTEEAEAAYKKAIEVNPSSVEAHISLGEYYFSQRKMPEAEAAIRAACDLDKHAVLPRLFLGRIYAATGRLSEAEKLYADLKILAPDDPRAYQALGMFYFSTRQLEKAAPEFALLAAAKPNDISVTAYRIETLIDLNRMDQADPLVKKALNANGDNPRILLASGRILIAQGKYHEAIASLEKSIKIAPDPAAYYFLGLAQKGAGLPGQAKTSFAQALSLSPRMSEAAAAMAFLDVNSGDHDEAMRMADKALDVNPKSTTGHLAEARALMAKGDFQRGEAELQAALQSDPVSLPALAMLLKLSISRGGTPEVLQRLSGLVEQHPQNAGLYFLRGLGYYTVKDLGNAEANVKKALAIDANTPDAYTLLANIDFARGQPGKAKSDLRSAIAAHPRTVSNYVALGTQLEKEQNWEEAKKMFEKAHEIDPASPYLSAELAFLYLEHGGDINLAVSLAQASKQKLPDSPISGDALGWAYYRMGAMDQAIAELKECVMKTPGNPLYQYHLGMAYVRAHRMDMAARSLRMALKDDPNFPYANSARSALDEIAQKAR